MKGKSEALKESREVIHMTLRPGMTVDELVREMGKSGCLGAGRLALAVDIYEEMVREEATIFFGLAGAIVPAGLRGLISDMIRNGLIHVLVTTGASIVHDLVETFGGRHYRGSERADDRELRQMRVDRIYDVFVREDDFIDKFDKPMMAILKEVKSSHSGPIGIRELLTEIAKRLPEDENSILRTAYKHNVPVFVPAIQDSCFSLFEVRTERGLMPVEFTELGLVVDSFKDLPELFDIAHKAKKLGAVIVGGGVPKNFLLQTAIRTYKPFDYAIQITMDRPEPGGLSGATLEEAVSWGKVKAEAKKVQVIGDAVICLPIIVASLLDRLKEE